MQNERRFKYIGIALGLSLLLLLALSSESSLLTENETIKYQWQRFQLEYASDWKLDFEADHDQSRNVRFIPKNPQHPVVVLLSIKPEARPPDAYYLEKPGLAALSFGSGIADQAALREDSEGGFISYGEVQLGDGPAATAQIVRTVKDSKRYASVQSFVKLNNGYLVMGVVITFGEEGKVVEATAYHKEIASAYALLRTIQIVPK